MDPFCGSGTTLRVCQQLNRSCIGIEINPEYIQVARRRLKQPFDGFDSIDERMARVPSDFNNEKIRDEYLKNHKKWFLKYHPNVYKKYSKEVERKYGVKLSIEKNRKYI